MKLIRVTKSNSEGSIIGYLIVKEEAGKEEIDFLIDEWCARDTKLGVSMSYATSWDLVTNKEELVSSLNDAIASTSIEITRLVFLRDEIYNYLDEVKNT